MFLEILIIVYLLHVHVILRPSFEGIISNYLFSNVRTCSIKTCLSKDIGKSHMFLWFKIIWIQESSVNGMKSTGKQSIEKNCIGCSNNHIYFSCFPADFSSQELEVFICSFSSSWLQMFVAEAVFKKYFFSTSSELLSLQKMVSIAL